MKNKIIPIIVFCLLLISGCSAEFETTNLADNGSSVLEYSSLSELSSVKRFAVTTGTIFGECIKEMFPQAEISYYSSTVDCALAVAKHKADATVYDAPVLQYISQSMTGVEMMPDYLMKDNYHFCLGKTERGQWLKEEFDEWLVIQKENGVIDKMSEFWVSNEDPKQIFDFSKLPEINGKIIIATSGGSRPDVYYYKNTYSGFPIELIYNFCKDKGFGAEIILASDNVYGQLATGKADFALYFMSYTEERAESVLFTDPVLESGIGILVRSNEKNTSSLLETIKSGFIKTFIREDRWKTLVSGLKTAIIISLGGFALANILGAIFCYFAMSKYKWLRIFADIYNRIMQGTPMVVILMVLYYLVFGNSEISGIWIAIIAFGLTSGASLSQQFYVAITNIDKGQTEAGLAIGFTNIQTFVGIVLPQAIRIILPGYFSEFINLMKGTSIVGYVSIVDLTRAGDLIRSSTYDPFFPLLSVAFIYFLISFLLLCFLKYLQKKIAPKRYFEEKEEVK